MFICGSASFSHQDEKYDHNESFSPKRSKKTNSSNKNPYADRGLDKFYALLQDLDNKKRSIYTQQGSEDISLVRFVYTDDSNHIKPIVIKKQEKSSSENLVSKKSFKSSTSNINQDDAVTTAASQRTPEEKPRKKRRSFRCKGRFEFNNLRQPFFCIPMTVILVLLFLAMYGRSFAIMCTTIMWYVCPSVIGGTSPSSPSFSLSNERKPKRKEYERKQSVGKKKIHVQSQGPTSPKSVITGLMEINK